MPSPNPHERKIIVMLALPIIHKYFCSLRKLKVVLIPLAVVSNRVVAE